MRVAPAPSAPPAPQEGSAPRRWLIAAVLLGFVAAVILVRLSRLNEPFAQDAAVYAVIGSSIADGQAPYIDFFDHKQPLIYPVFLLIELLDPTLWVGARVASALFAGLAVGLGVLVVQRVGGWRRALLGGAIAVVVGASQVVEGIDLNTEHLMVLTSAVAVLLPLWWWDRPARWVPFVAGVLGGLAVLTKATAIFTVGVALIPLLAGRRQRDQSAVTTGVSYAAGGVLPLALLIGVYAFLGGLPELWDGNIGFNLGYVEEALPKAVFPSGLFLLSSLGLAVAAMRLHSLNWRDVTTWTLLAWLAGALAGALFGEQNFPQYFAPVVLPAALAAVLPIGRKWPRPLSAASLVLAIAITIPFLIEAGHHFTVTPEERIAAESPGSNRLYQRQVADWFDEHARPGDRLLVNGSRTGLYWAAGVAPYFEYLYVPRTREEEYAAALAAAMATDPPDWVLIAWEWWPDGVPGVDQYPYRVATVIGPNVIYRLQR